jgi:hypothetical protein
VLSLKVKVDKTFSKKLQQKIFSGGALLHLSFYHISAEGDLFQLIFTAWCSQVLSHLAQDEAKQTDLCNAKAAQWVEVACTALQI